MEKIYKSKLFIILSSILVLYTILGFVFLPYFIQKNFSNTLRTTINTNGYLEKVYINPYTFEIELTNLLIQDKKNINLLYFNKLSLDFEFTSLFSDTLILKYIHLNNLKTNIILDKNKITNFQYIVNILNKNNNSNTKTVKQKDSKITFIKINDIKLLNNRVVIIDNSKSTPFKLETKSFNINIQNLSTTKNSIADFRTKIDMVNTASLYLDSKFSLNPMSFDGDFKLSNLQINKMYSYIKDDIDFKLSGNKVDLSLKYSAKIDNNIKVKLTDFQTTIDDLKFKNNEIAIDLESLNNKINSVNIIKKADILDVKLDGKFASKNIQANRSKELYLSVNNTNTSFDYKISLQNDKIDLVVNNTNILFKDTEFKNNDFKLNLSKLSNSIKQIDINKDGNKTIDLSIKDIVLKEKNILFTDFTKKEPIKLNIKNIKANVDKFTLDKSESILFKLSLDTPKKGKIFTKGDVVLEPLKANIELKTKEIVFFPYLPYIKEFANIDIKSGTISSEFDISVSKRKNIIDPKIKGDISIENLDISHSLTNQRVFSIKQFKIDNLSYKKDDINIQNILLDSVYTKFAIAKDKTTNIDNIVPQKQEVKNTKKEEKSKLKYFVENLDLKDSKIDFSDFSLPLNFATKIHSLKANVKAISSSNINTKLNLNGMVDKYGLAKIHGELNTANFEKKSDIKVNFENLDLISVSPYSGKFIGNKISSGKLWLDLAYKIKDSNLSSSNNIKIKNLELGEQVDSNESVNLPIGLAIALLEDSDGFIDVDVPVTGDISKPEFHLGGAIWSAVGNIITNIITAPFRFLGSLFGSDTDGLGEIDFDYGTAQLLAPQVEKLDKLLVALSKKKKLILKLNPKYDEINDKLAMQEQKFLNLSNKKNKDKIIKDMFFKIFTQKEYEKLISVSKDKDINDMMSKMLIPTMEVSRQELTKLSQNRVKAIQTYFLSHELDSSRLIVSNKIDFIEDSNNTKKRVTLNLDVEIKN